MDEGDVSYETLQEMLRLERRSNKLTPLANGFWAKLQAFLKEIEDDFRDAQAKDPFAKRVMMMTDRIKNARHAAEAVWTLRERKIAMLALAHVRDPGEVKGLTKLEAALYEDILKSLQDGRAAIFEGTAEASPRMKAARDQERTGQIRKSEARADAPVAQPDEPPDAGPDVDTATKAQPRPEAASAEEGPSAPATEPAPTEPHAAAQPNKTQEVPPDEAEGREEPSADAGRPPVQVPSDTNDPDAVMIRALGAIPPFVGPDMQTYLLEEGDVASVPKSIGDLLVRRGKAAIIEADGPAVNA